MRGRSATCAKFAEVDPRRGRAADLLAAEDALVLEIAATLMDLIRAEDAGGGRREGSWS